MNKKKLERYKKYYLIGAILFIISLIILVFVFFLPTLFKNNNLVNIISIIVIVIFLIVLFISIYILKKANKLKLDNLLSKSNEKYLNNK